MSFSKLSPGVSGVLRALRHRNFRLFFFGQMMSVAGSWMQRVALSWLAYRLTGSSSFLGLLTFAGSAPAFLLAPLAGLIADRVNRHHMLIVAQSLSLLQGSALAWISLSGRITSGWLLFLSLGLGV